MNNLFDLEDIGEFNEDEEVNKTFKKLTYKYFPKSRLELIKCIALEMQSQKPRVFAEFKEFKEAHKDNKFFKYEKFIPTIDLNSICTTEVTSMSDILFGVNKWWNYDVSGWDVSNVEDMRGMFEGCAYFDCDLSSWGPHLGKVKSMASMFKECYRFKHSLSNWDVSSVEDMSHMFEECIAFDQPIDGWDVRKVQDMTRMFYKAMIFNQSLNKWKPYRVKKAKEMFTFASLFEDKNKNLKAFSKFPDIMSMPSLTNGH